MMSVAGEAWPSQLDGRTTLPRPRDLAGELCTPRPPRSHAGNTGTCGQRATGPGLGLPPVIEHVGDLLKRPSSARTHGTRVRRSRRATSWDRYTLLAPATAGDHVTRASVGRIHSGNTGVRPLPASCRSR